jgi:hypothetical protein
MEAAADRFGEDGSELAWRRFCPPSGCLEVWLAPILRLGGAVGAPMVSAPGGCTVPQVKFADSRWEVTAMGIAESRLLERSDPPARIVRNLRPTLGLFRPPPHPGRYISIRMEIAYARDVEEADDRCLIALLRSSERPQVVRRSVGDDDERFRGLERVVARGRQDWASAGAWPWGMYENGKLNAPWKTDALPAAALERWCSAAAVEARNQISHLAAAVGAVDSFG